MPLAQIPASAIAATIFRANVPTAIGSTSLQTQSHLLRYTLLPIKLV